MSGLPVRVPVAVARPTRPKPTKAVPRPPGRGLLQRQARRSLPPIVPVPRVRSQRRVLRSQSAVLRSQRLVLRSRSPVPRRSHRSSQASTRARRSRSEMGRTRSSRRAATMCTPESTMRARGLVARRRRLGHGGKHLKMSNWP